MNRKLSISLLAGVALGIASAASAQTNRDQGLALSAEIAAQNAAMANSLQAANTPEVFGYTTTLRSLSQGRATMSLEPIGYAPAPQKEADRFRF